MGAPRNIQVLRASKAGIIGLNAISPKALRHARQQLLAREVPRYDKKGICDRLLAKAHSCHAAKRQGRMTKARPAKAGRLNGEVAVTATRWTGGLFKIDRDRTRAGQAQINHHNTLRKLIEVLYLNLLI